jgi:BirA family biotin operon repressor/biotin-[acetyl-CoA-carboxylase] ligase
MSPAGEEPPCFEHVACVDSTNAELLRRPQRANAAAPTILLADRQTAGRGRRGRTWLSDPEVSLTLSVSFEVQAAAGQLLGLPLAVGVAIADELARHGARCTLKWPNDLCSPPPRRAKLGGILIEVRQVGAQLRVVAGCGLNLCEGAAVTEATAGQPVAALFAAPDVPAREPLARSLGTAILQASRRFLAEGLQPFAARWRELDCLAGCAVEVRHADGRREIGVACGIDDSGALRVSIGGRVTALISGEVSVRAQ